METFSELLALCTGNSPVTGEFHAQRPVTRSFDVFFDLRLNECWVNHREAGYSRRRRAHDDATVVISLLSYTTCLNYIKVLGWWLSKLGSWRLQWTNGHRSRCRKNMDTGDWTQQQVYSRARFWCWSFLEWKSTIKIYHIEAQQILQLNTWCHFQWQLHVHSTPLAYRLCLSKVRRFVSLPSTSVVIHWTTVAFELGVCWN